MKKYKISLMSGVMVLFFLGAAWAGDHTGVPEDVPAIMASLDKGGLTVLSDTAIAEVRGQAYPQYVLVKILGLNTFDGGRGVQWTWNPLGYRYGYWGGPEWTNGGDTHGTAPFADGDNGMDALFMTHDQAYIDCDDPEILLAADKVLLKGLLALPNTSSYWGPIYEAIAKDAPDYVAVSGVSLIGGKIFFGWRKMAYTEYSRREAMAGLGLMIFGKSVGIRLQ
ncbi:MAG: hypothetical protein ACOWYE_15035 [Desulfatiglandales bacterium]